MEALLHIEPGEGKNTIIKISCAKWNLETTLGGKLRLSLTLWNIVPAQRGASKLAFQAKMMAIRKVTILKKVTVVRWQVIQKVATFVVEVPVTETTVG